MQARFLAAFAAAASLLPGTASACGRHPTPYTLLHSALPTPLPVGTIVAEVELERVGTEIYGAVRMRARVRRMIQGEDTRALILDIRRRHSCQEFYGNGRIGFIVGVHRGQEDGIPVVAPIWSELDLGYRLPDGYQLPAPGLQAPPPADGNTVVIED